MNVRFSRKADADLEDIGDYIAEENPSRAVTFVAEMRSRAQSLSSFSERHPLVLRYASAGIRRVNHGKYGIFYRVDQDEVVILRIAHGSREITALF